MISTRYLIVGGGMTGDAAVKGIREHDSDGSIVLVGAEPHPPYARPPLSKKLWSGGDEAKIWRGTEDAGADLHLGRRIVSLDLDAQTATDDAGEQYGWEKLLLATGGRPRTIPDSDGVIYFRTLEDYRSLRARVQAGGSAVVIGGGFIGSELAAALTTAGCRVTMVFPDSRCHRGIFLLRSRPVTALPVPYSGLKAEEPPEPPSPVLCGLLRTFASVGTGMAKTGTIGRFWGLLDLGLCWLRRRLQGGNLLFELREPLLGRLPARPFGTQRLPHLA